MALMYLLPPTAVGNRFNFSAGPGALPESVLAEVQAAIVEVPGTGLSVLGLGHRTDWFRNVLDEAEENLRALLDLPSDYHVLFLQGGSSTQFSMIPMALLRGRRRSADYIVSGYWSGKSIPDARREGAVRVLWNGESDGFRRLPSEDELEFDPHAAYLHYVSNETVEGLQFHRIPGLDSVPRVCDMSSDFLCRPVDIRRFALVYAHAQKNLGPAGVTVVLVRDDLLQQIPDDLPTMLDYRPHIAMRSIYNTPPVFAIYVTMLVTRWLRRTVEGVKAMADLNLQKAEQLYGLLDAGDDFYQGRAAARDRSWMNAAFRLPTKELEATFLREAEACGFHGLEGHRSIGGLRASLYNAVSLEAVETLCGFMQDFRERHTRNAR